MLTRRDEVPEIVVIDGTALLFRPYYGEASAKAIDGTPIGGVLGTARRLVDMMARTRTTHVAIVFDAGQRTFRNDLDIAYKANRGAPPPDLVPQFALVQEMVEALGFSTLCIPGFEADDLMATIARRAREQGWATWLLSPDKDLFQLVDDTPPKIRCYHWHERRVVDTSEVQAKIGVHPSRAVDYFALVGDSSDNVRGVRGVGPKAASCLVSELGNLSAIYARLDEVSALKIRGAKTLADRLIAGREDAELALKLVTLMDDIDLGLSDELAQWSRWRGPEPQAERLFERFGVDAPLRAMGAIYAQRPSAPPGS